MPIAYPLPVAVCFPAPPDSADDAGCVRVYARALEGMQKEVVVCRSVGGSDWRLLCDEGPYLDGTDLAPPPLAFFAAGMAAHNAGLLVEEAERRGLDLGHWSLSQDTYYTMEGSALQGTMTGGALPVDHSLASDRADSRTCSELMAAALRRSVAEALMASAFAGDFTIAHNDELIDTGRVKAASSPPPEVESALWNHLEAPDLDDGIIRKLRTVDPSSDPTHGKGASLREFQKRQLWLHSVLVPGSDGQFEVTVELRQPLGSVFCFRAAAGEGATTAPGGLDYLASGIALCFLTQMGRYAKIIRGDLAAYSVVQDFWFRPEPPKVRGIETHARVHSREDHDTVRRYVDMSEQTCFLHASCRSVNPSRISDGRST